ncbi:MULTISPECIES: hypothetical protein [Flammeovirga]|uniref:Uncharacterized protein n=1 Tax=Flammeovirga agarivorans TaxID=2726742 RepID=A0A7X8SIS5_9BACT|nr:MULTISPECIES: hypothetical protein [Flammeovirga]NLR90912.1 hypothetical protein [Flammeovirga agarivorans]
MKKISLIILSLLCLLSTSIYASNNDPKEEEGKKTEESNEKFDYMHTAPKLNAAPFIKGVAADGTVEIYKEGRNHVMLIDKESENILFDNLKEGKDFVRVYTDYTDNKDCIIIWSMKKKDRKTGNITWKKYTYKKFDSVGWRPVDNMTTAVKSFK